MIGFRIMLVIWSISAMGAGFSAFAYSQSEASKAEYQQIEKIIYSNALRRCIEERCAGKSDSELEHCEFESQCHSYVSRTTWHINDDTFQAALQASMDWNLKGRQAINWAVSAFLLSSFIFYSMRFAILGRLEPVWLLGRDIASKEAGSKVDSA